jgi:hypothetical protein
METAKVDIRKLQLLNDRINQCIEALNQVRLSVHGLSHTAGTTPGVGIGWAPGFGGAYGSPGGIGYPQAGLPSPYPQGFSHTAGISPFGGTPPGISPAVLSPQPWQQSPFLGFGGLSHTSPEMLTDPFLAARIAQTFPYVQFLAPPIVAY